MNEEILIFGDTMPVSFGRRIPTFRYFTSFKTKAWHNIALLCSIILLRNRVSLELLTMWSQFVEAVSLSLKFNITYAETRQIDILFSTFI
jgi:hypothetical protein